MRNLINHIFAWMVALAVALLGAAAAPASAQSTISNVAQIDWQTPQGRFSRLSNQVDLAVDLSAPIAILTTYQLLSSSGSGTQLSVPQTICRGSSGDSVISLDGVWSNTSLSPASVEQTSQIRAGEPLVVSINAPHDNKDPNRIETISVRLQTPSGDSETILVRETAVNSSQFVGLIRTASIPPDPRAGDCKLSLFPGERLMLESHDPQTGTLIAQSALEVLIDPYGVVFDSGDGSPVAGTRVTLVDAATGQPAQVFGDDGVSAFPSSIMTGSTVTDSGGMVYQFAPGEYRFPFARPGQYRLIVETPQPYTVPSRSAPANLVGLRRPDAQPFAVVTGSYGEAFTLIDPAPVRIDIPADRPGIPLLVRKTASQPTAIPGDAVQFRVEVRNGDTARATGPITITDKLPDAMRIKKGTVRFDGVATDYQVSTDGSTLTISAPALAAGKTGYATYVVEIRPDAAPGNATNLVSAADNRGTQSAVADATVRIARDSLADRMTIIGRITDGGCTVDPAVAKGVANVRVMLEDGSYSVTDIEGRYHFEGVLPGLHVVQIDPSTLPAGQVAAQCALNARSAGSAISRFVEGRGGALLRADFRTVAGENTARLSASNQQRPAAPSAADAAGANRDWFANQAPGIAWLFPEADHNPRTKAVRVAIKHLPGQSVKLYANGTLVPALAFDGAKKDANDLVAVSLWRGVELPTRETRLTADILDANGTVVEHLERTVTFSSTPMHAVLDRARSVLVADGVTRPVIALKLTDRDGHPVHQGLTGDFTVPAPYYPAVEADAQAARQLSGLERAKPVWRVEGDDGVAYIELEPTTASGSLNISLPLRDGDVVRTERIDAWLDPGKRPWTIVGFAAGTAGFNTLETRSEKLGANGDSWLTDARLALYAKGRVKGKWLMTMSYDSDKEGDDTRFGGVIDPNAYYTVYADRSTRRFDAASVRRLYLKLERPQFYALFGDYETGLGEAQLTRYVRSFNGVKAEFRNEQVGATAFAADTPFRHRREEIQGNGLSGPYALAARDILPNSEKIVIETRDRLRSDRIVESRTLVRNVDYDIDYVAGTLRFSEPVLSRSSGLDPQFIIADYDVDGVAQRVTNAGGRVTWNNAAKTLTVGATGVHDEDDNLRTSMGGVDVRYKPSAQSEIRAEFAVSDQSAVANGTKAASGTNTAWLVEAEHHGSRYDVLAYAREQETGFGVGQTNGGENGTRKFGVDGRMRMTQQLSATGSAWHEEYLDSVSKRDAVRGLIEYRAKSVDLRSGLTVASDRLSDGTTAGSTIAQFGAAKRFLNNKLELDAQTEVPLADKDESVDFPARHKFGLRYAFNEDITLVGAYEIANGKAVDARTARVGFDLKPWAGARFTSSVNRQDIAEYGPRSFAAFGLAQSLPVTPKLTLDFTLDANKTLGGVDATKVLNTAHPVSSGGFIGNGDTTLTDDFTAITTGATYRGDRWSWTGRAEMRTAATGNRYGLTTAVLRQIGEGRAVGGQFSWTRAKATSGVETQATALALSLAHRPADSRLSILDKLELRSDIARNAVAGEAGPIGGAVLTISGDVKSQRIINSFSLNWSPTAKIDGQYVERSEVSFFWGSRYVFDRFGVDDLKGWSNLFGTDLKYDAGKGIDLGLSGTIRQNPGGRSYSWSGGPAIGISAAKNSYVSVGYNVTGFHDRDYEASRYTRSGPFVTLRMKFDQGLLSGLGLGR
jgi:uncharacterized repeat protein (TIGR01451 family)